MLTLFLLGDLRLERGGQTLLAGRRKPLALLALLARRGAHGTSREELASLFWESSDDASGRRSLRQALSELRAVEGLSFEESEAGICLTPGVLATDVEFFEGDLRSSQWERAMDRWRGDFIPSGEALGGTGWQHWLDGERVALRRQLALACDHVTTAAERTGAWGTALDAAMKWRARLPDDSRAWCREIHALQAAGRIPEAIARATEGERYFRRELGIDVPDDLARISRVLGRVRDVAGTPAASLLTPDLVGRSAEMELLHRARVAARLGEAGRVVLVIAPEGLGKTRLLREFARSTRETDRQVLIIETSAGSSDSGQPLSFLQAIVSALATQEAIAGCAPETLAVLAEVAPEIRKHFRHLPSSGSSSDRLAALRSALGEVAHRSPVILLLDDLPAADDESQSVLASLLVSPLAGVLVAASGRPESWRTTRSLSAIPARVDPAQHCALQPLSMDETRTVLSSMAPLLPATRDELAETLHRSSGGNPGLLISSMTHLAVSRILTADDSGLWSAAAGAAAASTTSPAVVERWTTRHSAITPHARRVLDAAAILCNTALDGTTSLQALERLADVDAESFSTGFDHLRLCGVLRVRDARVSFAAGLYAHLAYDALAPSRRSALHARAARLLHRIADPGAREAVASHRVRSGRRLSRRLVTAAVVGAAALAAVAWLGFSRNGARVPPRTPVLLADVLNLTGDTAFDQTLYLAASVGLQQSKQVSLFPRSRVRETLALMQRPGADSTLDEALAREIAIRENLRRVVHVTVARVEPNYLVAGRIIDPSSGADLFTHQERVGDRADVLVALDRVLSEIRRGVGESADSIRASSIPLPRVTTSSLPALQAYARALRESNARHYGDAMVSFLRAVELDSSFALAWLGLADLYYQQANDRAQALAALAMAERHADRLTDRERLRLELSAARYRGDPAWELRVAESLARRFPETQTWFALGTTYMSRRNCAEAIASFERALGYDSSFVAAHLSSATCHQFIGASDRAVAAYNRAHAVDSLAAYQGFHNHQFGVALVRAGMLDSARAVYERMIRRPVSQDQQFGHRSLAHLAAWTGHWREANAQFDSAARLAREANTPLSVFRNRILQADLLLTVRQTAMARQALDAAWSLRGQIPIAPAFAMYSGLAFVRANQLDRAAEMLRRIEAAMQQESGDDRTVRAILAARIALAQNRTAAARGELEAATDTTRGDYTLPALVDVFLALGHRDSALVAATQFESRAVFGIDAQDAWQRNLLIKAIIAEESGRIDVATTSYARLESQLREGDADHLLLVESRRGLARLAVRDARR